MCEILQVRYKSDNYEFWWTDNDKLESLATPYDPFEILFFPELDFFQGNINVSIEKFL